jgi:hypothetical protein
MSVQPLLSHLRECHRRLSELRGRQDYLALSCAMLRLEGSGGTVLYDQPFSRILNGRPIHVCLTASHGETFAVAFYPVADGIEANRIPAAIAPVEAIARKIHPLLRKLPEPVRERLRLPDNDNWWRIVFHLGWHFPRPFLSPVRCRLLARGSILWGISDETFVQLHGTGGQSDLLPGLIYSALQDNDDLCTCSETAVGTIIDALERHVQMGQAAGPGAPAFSTDQRRGFDQLRADFLAGTQLPQRMLDLECKLLKLADSFNTPPASEWSGLEVGGSDERFLTLSRLNDMQEIVQIRGPATEWFCNVAERAGDALPAFVPDYPILFDDERGFSAPHPVMNRGGRERWVGFVFATLKQHGHDALCVRWETNKGPLSHGLATLDLDLFAASVLAIDLARLTTAAEEESNRERATCSPFSVPSMEELGLEWAEAVPPPPAPPENYTLGHLVEDLRRFGEYYHQAAERIQEEHPAIQKHSRIRLGAFVSNARDSLLRIPGFTELREQARSLWDEEISFAVGRRIVDALLQWSNGSLSAAAAESLTLAEVALTLTPAHEGNEMLAPTDTEARQQIADALETWKRVLYPNLPGGPLPLTELVKLTNSIVAWRDRYAPHFDVTPLDEVRRILVRRAAGETTPEEELRTAGERAARACDRIKDWLQTVEAPSATAMAAPVDFVVITALEEERDAVLALLPNHRKAPPSGEDVRVYFHAELPVKLTDGSECLYRIVVVTPLNMGRVEAANVTSDAIRRWRPRFVLLVGIAGGIADMEVDLGDVLISDQVVDFELQKVTQEGQEVRYSVHRADPSLVNAAKNYLSDDWLELISVKRPRW